MAKARWLPEGWRFGAVAGWGTVRSAVETQKTSVWHERQLQPPGRWELGRTAFNKIVDLAVPPPPSGSTEPQS